MIDLAHAARSIYGVWRLAHLDRNGMTFLDGSRIGAIRSFSAAVLLLPAFIILELLQYRAVLGQIDLFRWVILETLFYVIAWTAYPVVLHMMAQVLDRSHRYCAALTAYNWSSVIQVAVFLPIAAAGALGLLPTALVATLTLIVFVALMVYLGFILSVSLEVSGGTAAMLVAVELILTLTLSHLFTEAITG